MHGTGKMGDQEGWGKKGEIQPKKHFMGLSS